MAGWRAAVAFDLHVDLFATGLIYLGYQIFSGNYRQVLFTHRDIPGVWPMVKHYFFFGPKPEQSAKPTTHCRSMPTQP